MATFTLRDETPAGGTLGDLVLPGLPDRMTVRALLRLRIREEVARHNAAPSRLFTGLVCPDGALAAPAGHRLPSVRRLDWERQAAIAERAFTRNGFIVLTGDHQVDDLDEEVAADTELVFIRLVQLVGG
jgi:xanthine/CO dehydrogenase XdhC/CoxF family maturation factor